MTFRRAQLARIRVCVLRREAIFATRVSYELVVAACLAMVIEVLGIELARFFLDTTWSAFPEPMRRVARAALLRWSVKVFCARLLFTPHARFAIQASKMAVQMSSSVVQLRC